MINSRNKGASFERKVCSELNGWLGCHGRRNVSQAQSGGDDIEFIGESAADDFLRRFSFELKNHSRITDADFNRHWEQCKRQACDVGKEPVMIYKELRQSIKVAKWSAEFECLVRMEFDDFLTWVREQVSV